MWGLALQDSDQEDTDRDSVLLLRQVTIHPSAGACPWQNSGVVTLQPHDLLLLKADVTKAHRRVKVLPKDWRYQVTQIQDQWWINKVGNYIPTAHSFGADSGLGLCLCG